MCKCERAKVREIIQVGLYQDLWSNNDPQRVGTQQLFSGKLFSEKRDFSHTGASLSSRLTHQLTPMQENV